MGRPPPPRLQWQTVIEAPRLHYATSGPWAYVIQPYTTNRFGAWCQRLGWQRSETRLFKSLAEAKSWLSEQHKINMGHT